LMVIYCNHSQIRLTEPNLSCFGVFEPHQSVRSTIGLKSLPANCIATSSQVQDCQADSRNHGVGTSIREFGPVDTISTRLVKWERRDAEDCGTSKLVKSWLSARIADVLGRC
jgi:hypothetical protein